MCSLVLSAIFAASIAAPQDMVNFARTYKVGDKATYTVSFETKLFGGHAMSVDVGLTTLKVLENGMAQVLAHESNKQASGQGTDTTKIPEDLTFTLAANNMPDKFTPRDDASQFEFFLFIASSTPGKAVKVGDDLPWSWSTESISLSGSSKVLEISADKKKLKALITQRMKFKAQDVGGFTLTSNYDLKDGSLIDSAGEFVVADFKQQLKFVRK
jgi:hypothetical protein